MLQSKLIRMLKSFNESEVSRIKHFLKSPLFNDGSRPQKVQALMEHLETVEVDEARRAAGPLRLPVQWVNRPHQNFRGFAGTIASGVVRSGDRLRVLPSGKESRVARIVTQGGDLEEAEREAARAELSGWRSAAPCW